MIGALRTAPLSKMSALCPIFHRPCPDTQWEVRLLSTMGACVLNTKREPDHRIQVLMSAHWVPADLVLNCLSLRNVSILGSLQTNRLQAGTYMWHGENREDDTAHCHLPVKNQGCVCKTIEFGLEEK